MNAFAVRLRTIRKQRKLTQRELASKLNMSQSTIALYETGDRKPDPDTINKIADFFDVSTDYLLGRSDDTINIYEEFRRIQESIPKWGDDAGQIALDETK